MRNFPRPPPPPPPPQRDGSSHSQDDRTRNQPQNLNFPPPPFTPAGPLQQQPAPSAVPQANLRGFPSSPPAAHSFAPPNMIPAPVSAPSYPMPGPPQGMRPPPPPSFSTAVPRSGPPRSPAFSAMPPPPPQPQVSSFQTRTAPPPPFVAPPAPIPYGNTAAPPPPPMMQQQYSAYPPAPTPPVPQQPPMYNGSTPASFALPALVDPDSQSFPVYYPNAAITQGNQIDLPPPADATFTVQDDGNASPEVIRASMYAVPLNRGILNKMGNVPLGVCCTPLAVSDVPCIRESEPPPRCRTCAAYPNPFFGANDGMCNLCGTKNKEIVSRLAGPAMQYGTVDYEVSGPYITREIPVQPVSIYALDMTCPHVQEYFSILALIGRDMAEHFWNQPDRDLAPRIGLCLVSARGIAIYSQNDRRYNIVTDVSEDPFCPLPLDEWTFDLSTPEGLDAWESFVGNEISANFQELKKELKGKLSSGQDSSELSCGGAAIKFLSEALSYIGGRGTLITWRRPNYGVGKTSYREQQASTGEPDGAFSAYTPLQYQKDFKEEQDKLASSFYADISNQCVKDRITLDIIFHTPNVRTQPYSDLATLGEVCRKTSGKLVWITDLDWRTTMLNSIRRPLMQSSVWDAIFKLRCSDGIQVKSFASPPGKIMEGSIGTSPELEFSSLAPSTCISVNLDYRVGGLSKERKFVYVQSALLYSTLSGKRMVRVSTLALRSTSSPVEAFACVDPYTSITLQMKEASSSVLKISEDNQKDKWLENVRNAIYHPSIAMLASAPQLGRLPERLQLLPLAINCVFKSPFLRRAFPRRLGNVAKLVPSADERAYFMFHFSQLCPQNLFGLLHPVFYHVVDGKVESSYITPSISELKDDSVYLVDTGLRMYLLIGKDSPTELKELAESREQLSNSSIGQLVFEIQSKRSTFRPVFAPITPVIHDGSMLDADVMDLMIYDAVAGESTYSDLFQKLMTSVQQRIQNKK